MQKRAKEWLALECPDPQFMRAFDAVKMGERLDDSTLIALGAQSAPLAFFADPPNTNPVTDFAFRLLGYVPDREKERLRLRPDFPIAWTHATVRNIRVGDALVTLEFRVSEDETLYTIEQPGGPYPVTLIFEPVLKRKFEKVWIDDVEAQLDIAVVGSAVVAPVQLVLADKRSVRFTRK